MGVEILCFHQEGCPGCDAQQAVNQEIEKKLGISIQYIDAVRTEGVIQTYALKVTPTILILVDGRERERFEGEVTGETLEESLKKYIWL